jgi:predicted acetyltransferase
MIIYSEEQYKSSLLKLWKLCFPQDSDEFIGFYFDKVYKNGESLLYLENEKPVAFLQMIPYSLKIGKAIYTAGYLSGVMTHPDYRGKGYMGRLLNLAFEAMKEKGFDYTFLIPQEEWLIEVYKKFGYQLFVSPTLKEEFKLLKALKSLNYTEHARFLTMIPNAVLKSEEQFANIVADSLADGGALIDTKEKRGMIKKINPLAETVTCLYLGRMLD